MHALHAAVKFTVSIFRQIFQNISDFVDGAALDGAVVAVEFLDSFADGLATVDDEENWGFGVKTSVDEIVEKIAADLPVFGVAVADAEDHLFAFSRDIEEAFVVACGNASDHVARDFVAEEIEVLKGAVASEFDLAPITLDPGLFNEHALTLEKYRSWVRTCTVAKPTGFAGKGFSTKLGEFLVEEVIEEPLRGTSELIPNEASHFLVDISNDVE